MISPIRVLCLLLSLVAAESCQTIYAQGKGAAPKAAPPVSGNPGVANPSTRPFNANAKPAANMSRQSRTNPNARFPNHQNGNARDRRRGATIPLGNLAFGSNVSFPWFLPFGFGYGYPAYGYGYPAAYSTNGYYGVGSGGFGFDNLAGGGSLYASDPGAGATTTSAQAPPAGNTAPVPAVIENAMTADALHYQFREGNREYRARQIATERTSPQTMAKVALESLPRVLGPDEFNATTGTIAWPKSLLAEAYRIPRETIEEQVPLLASSKGMENYEIVREATREMVEILRSQITEMPADEFLISRKFLDSVEYAANKLVSR